MEKWKTFKLNGKELCSYTLYGESSGEEQATVELLSEENNCNVTDIEIVIEDKMD